MRYPNAKQRQSILKQSNYAAGEPYKIRSSVGIKSHQDAINWIGGGGVISLGISWAPPMRTINGRKTAVDAAKGGGGHAIAALGYKKNGNLVVANSHAYWMDITPDAFTAMLRHRWTVAIGLSDMANPQPRTVGQMSKNLRKWAGNLKGVWS